MTLDLSEMENLLMVISSEPWYAVEYSNDNIRSISYVHGIHYTDIETHAMSYIDAYFIEKCRTWVRKAINEIKSLREKNMVDELQAVIEEKAVLPKRPISSVRTGV